MLGTISFEEAEERFFKDPMKLKNEINLQNFLRSYYRSRFYSYLSKKDALAFFGYKKLKNLFRVSPLNASSNKWLYCYQDLQKKGIEMLKKRKFQYKNIRKKR